MLERPRPLAARDLQRHPDALLDEEGAYFFCSTPVLTEAVRV